MSAPAERLPQAIYSVAQVRQLDRIAIERHGIPGYELMTRAAHAALDVLQAEWPAARRIEVYCGAGNNGGDGYVLARLARAAGRDVRVGAVAQPEGLRGDAARAHADCVAAGVPIVPLGQDASFAAELIVDGLLGTGASRPVDGHFARAIAAIGAAGVPVLALDIPSGLHGDTGEVLGLAVAADVTITFVGLKTGLFLGEAPDHRGRLEFAGLGVPGEAYAEVEPPLRRLVLDDLRAALPPRRRSAHKGSHGRLLVVGGGEGMPGAARLAAEAALRTGAGLVYVATHPSSVGPVMAGRPELICHGIGKPEDLDPLLAACDGIVAGPGLGRTPWAEALWQRVLAAPRPLVADADALNLLAARPTRRERWLLTPHPAEAGRLLGSDAAAVQRDRAGAATALVARYGAAAVLKGACSLVAAAEPDGRPDIRVCDRGNPGMATAGTGDVLAGVLGALLVQTGDLACAARAGVLLHALAGDAAAAGGERGMIAGDLLPQLREWANPS